MNSRKKGKKMKYLVIAITSLLLLLVMVIVIWNTYIRTITPQQAIEKTLSIDLGDGLTLEEGKVHWDGDFHVKAKFLVEEDSYEQLCETLENRIWEYDISEMPTYRTKAPLKQDMENKQILHYYDTDIEGRKAKTISVEAFLAIDATGKYYFYIFI